MKLRSLLAVLVGLSLALGVACGGGDDGGGSPGGDGGSSGGGGGAEAPTQVVGGGSPGGGGGTTLQDACTLLTEGQVNAALGDDTVASSAGEPPTEAVSTCQWQGTKTGNRFVMLTIRTAQFATSVFESNYRDVEGAVSVPGIGDEAFALPGMDTPNNYRFLTMAALTSSLYIQINIAGPNRPDEAALETLTTAMQQVVSNLQ
ncbi:MAG TPA: hypothetical protein VFS30_11800 [Dehalococcoidia bacterium]|nr:hypothetical protein [Dehalococcoidia bacterium]